MNEPIPEARVPDYDQVWSEVYGDIQDVGPTHRHMRRILRRMLGTIDYQSVLDVGCGAGHNFPELLHDRQVKRLTGLDISAQALDQARQRYDGDFHLLDIQQEHPDGQWDLVFSSLLLEHLPDDLAALRHMRAAAGKYLLVTTIAGDFERYRAWDEQMGHVRNYRRGELEEKLAQAGFTPQQVIYWGFPFYTPLARTLQNRAKAQHTFSQTERIIAQIMYYLYWFNSHRRGDILFALARVNDSDHL